MMSARDVMPKVQGFTLIEVLVAMLLLSGGMLGFAALQGVSLKNSQQALQHSTAAQLAYDLADRIRANNDPVNTSLALPVYVSLSPAAALPQSACTPTVAGTSGCPRNVMAQNDLFEWFQNASANTQLPGVIATITNNGGRVYNITIYWDSNRDGVVDIGLGTDNFYQMSLHL